MSEQNSSRERLRAVLEKRSKEYGDAASGLNAMRAAVLLDALDDSEVTDFDFYNLAVRILGPGAENFPHTK